MQRAQAALDPLRARLAAVPTSGLIGPIGDARVTLGADLDEASRRLSAAGTNLSIAVPMLGGEGPRDYLIMLQDPTIAAGPGGGIVAYALVSADGGVLLDRTPTGDHYRAFDEQCARESAA